jgi:uncharacterized protein YycO
MKAVITLALLMFGLVGCATQKASRIPMTATPQVGDVLFCSHPSFTDSVIRWRTLSKFSHVAVCVSPTEVIDALPKGGVKRRPIQQHLEYNWVLCRPHVPLNDIQQRDLVGWLDSKVGLGYDFWGILGFGWNASTEMPTRYFCSEIVFRAFESIGVLIVPRKTAGLIAPEVEYQSLFFDAVDYSSSDLLKTVRKP